MTTTIWHNPRCSKSRNTLALLRKHGVETKERLYLDDRPTPKELEWVIKQLGITPWELLRRGEAIFKESKLTQDSSGIEIIQTMSEHPKLIERPVVIHGERVAIGRPPENVLALYD